MQPVKIYKSISKDRSVIFPFMYYTEYNESLFCLKYSCHKGNALVYLHYDGSKQFLAEAILSDYPIHSEDINPFDEMKKKIPTEDVSFDKLLFDMHLAACSSLSTWYDKNILYKIKNSYSKPPILIGGCGRSGTTLLLSILSTHSSIQAINDEIYAFYPRPYRLQRLETALAKKNNDDICRWCEKTPKNIRAIPDILKLLGKETKFIHIVRDPRDVITSVHPNHPGQYWVTPDRWIEDVSEGLRYQEHTLIVKYEDLVLDLKNTVHKICNYIEESFEDQMLDVEKNATVRQNIAWGKEQIKPMHSSGIQRWNKKESNNIINQMMKNEKVNTLMKKLKYLA